MFKIEKFKAALMENGLSVADAAAAMGISKQALYRKLANNGNSFTVAEATNIGLLLELNASEMNDIFFAL